MLRVEVSEEVGVGCDAMSAMFLFGPFDSWNEMLKENQLFFRLHTILDICAFEILCAGLERLDMAVLRRYGSER
jgi:hypothetical protein